MGDSRRLRAGFRDSYICSFLEKGDNWIVTAWVESLFVGDFYAFFHGFSMSSCVLLIFFAVFWSTGSASHTEAKLHSHCWRDSYCSCV